MMCVTPNKPKGCKKKMWNMSAKQAAELCKPKTGKTYEALGHAVQSGVRYELETDQAHRTVTDHVKHLRTGLDLRAADHNALAMLLIAKGVFTSQEYEGALLAAAEREVELYEARANKRLGRGDDPANWPIRFA